MCCKSLLLVMNIKCGAAKVVLTVESRKIRGKE